MADQISPVQPDQKKLNFSLDYRIVVFILLAVIVGMLVAWRPWQEQLTGDSRTVTVTGESKVSAEPDEYVFYPRYEFKNTDKTAGLKEVASKSEEIITGLKKLGIKDNKIKTNSDGNSFQPYFREDDSNTTYSLALTITSGQKDEAQKIQDYLVSTGPVGAVSPQASFSEKKRKELESQARDKATQDARAKADQSAKNLGFKIHKVKSVEDGVGFVGLHPQMATDMALSAPMERSISKLAVQPGENELNYTVKVVYFVR